MRKILFSLLFSLPLSLAAEDLEFKEAFADPASREAALARLVPQTRDWFFYQALNHQLAGRTDAYRKTMADWKTAAQKPGVGAATLEGYDILENREILLRFDADPKKATDEMIHRAGMTFDDAKPDARADEKLPDRLDPARISVQAFEQEAIDRGNEAPYRQLKGERLAAELAKVVEFDEAKLLYFRQTLTQADLPGVVALLTRVHRLPQPPRFGSASIENRLTRAQLDELAAAVPALRGNQEFATRCMTTLLPGAETDFELDPSAHAAHLAACRDFALTLPPALNSLKAHVLFHHLRLQRDLGQYPQEDFLAYLRLPRNEHPILRPVQQRAADPFINPAADYSPATGCPPIGDDSALVSEYLQHFLGSAETPDLFKDLIEEKKLRLFHARARLLAGADPVAWGASIPPAELLEMQKETRIVFAPGQGQALPADAEVKLALDLKNTPDLLVRIFELDLPAWIEREGSEPPVDLDLEGLVPHHEKRLSFAQPPLVLHRETLDLPELAGPGAWVVECVSKEVSSRALIRKGRLIAFVDHEARGQSVKVFGEDGTLLKDASVSLGTETFAPDASGKIVIPDKTSSSRTTGLVRQGKLAVPLSLEARRDEISLDARFHVDREQLLADQQASLFIRLRLNSHGREIPLEWIDKPSLVMQATLAGGLTTERVIGGDLKLSPRMFIPFQVPADTIALTMKLTGSVTPRDGDDPKPLEASKSWELNNIVTSGRIAAGFFTRDTEGYRMEVRGRNGEPLSSRPVTFQFTHRNYASPIEVTLRSDDRGRVALGTLPEIVKIGTRSSDIGEVNFKPDEEAGWSDFPAEFQLAAGDEIRLPLLRPMAVLDRARVSLSEWRGEALLRDHFDKLALDKRQLVLRGLPAGDFRLVIDGKAILIRSSAAAERDGLLVSAARIMPRFLPPLPFVMAATPEAGALVVKVDGASPGTRVSLLGRRYLHDWSGGAALQPFGNPLPALLTPGFTGNAFLESKRLSDEMRYILDRRAAKTFPGSMLPRAGLLVNRWSEDDVVQAEQKGEGGRVGHGTGGGRSGGREPAPSTPPEEREGDSNGEATLDFLARTSVLRLDLPLGADGTVQVPAADFAQCQYLEIVAADTAGRHHLTVPLVPSDTPLRDRRLAKPLDAKTYHVGTRRAAALAKGAEASIESVLDADWRAFTTLAEAHQFLLGASSDTRLNDFLPLLDWPSLDEQKKLAFLSEHACHELHLFLMRKDPDFFTKHVKPMLAEKQEPTVVDNILLGRDLTAYLRPYAWQRLNAAEKALLSQAMPEARERVARELNLRWELEAPTPEQETQLFTQTLRGNELATEDSLGLAAKDTDGSMTLGGTSYLLEKTRNTIIPVIDFEDTSVEEAIDFLRLRSRELDTRETDPTRKGINFVIRKPRAGLDAASDPGALRIKELRLRNVPMAEALKYICEATRLRYKVDEYAVTLVPGTESDEDLFTRTFNVPRDFLNLLTGPNGAIREEDPFGTTEARKRGGRLTITEALKEKGVADVAGSSATLTGSRLVVRNTSTNIDLIESLVDVVLEDRPVAKPRAAHRGLSAGVPGGLSDNSGILPPLPSSAAEADGFASGGGGADHFAEADPFGGDGSTGAALKPRPPMDHPFSRPSWSSERDQTRLWRESNYYRYRGKTDESFIPLNRFWLDLALWDGKGAFISPNFNACTHNANEALFCLAMLDLPFKAQRPETQVDGSTLKVKAREPMLLFYKDTRETQKVAQDAPVLVRQIFHRLDDRFRTVDGRQVENSISGDFVAGVPYGASMVVTNPSGAGRRIDVLAQIPAGAIPLAGSPATTSETYELEPYGVQSLELAFYFPLAGEYAVYPLQVSENDTILARGDARVLRVSAEPPPADADSWPVLARDASNDAVLARMKIANLRTLDFKLIRWRLQDRGFFNEASKILRERLHYSADVASYGFLHGDVPAMRELVENSSLAQRLGDWLDSPIIQVRPLVHRDWESLEFDPLVNPRAHRFADKERLTHADATAHYTALLDTLAWKPALEAGDQLALTAHLLLQDRVPEALERFDKVDSNKLPATMAYDYIAAVVDFYRSKPEDARALAVRHSTLPPGQWKQRFDAIRTQADEIVALQAPRAAEPQKPQEEAPSLDLALAPDGKLVIKQQRLDKTLLQLFSVDLEMLFSKDPFLTGEGASQPGIRANDSREVLLAAPETAVDLPENFRHGNVLVAAKSGTTKVLKVLDSRSLEITRTPLERTLQVFDSASRLPVPQCYVKVYVEDSSGHPVFHKDGYTDLRGKFDYLSHTGSDLGEIHKIAVLVNHPEKGARIEVFDL
ncbi:hypothetical protein [Haloferula sp. BvORR071]|uniref:hypothetical protein n=1 Tax=Haloferula sp. BvORR071 TaxID=1396141 RepID=UPI000557C7B1|nr:hypothetical protein [Haloferula sp. BvORR071]